MKDLNTVLDLAKRVENATLGAAAKKQQIDLNLARLTASLTALEAELPALEKSLNNQGLSITKVSYSKTGMGTDWEGNDSLNVNIEAEPNSGKFRFITNKGYDSRGGAINRKQLEVKSKKIEGNIIAETNLTAVQVNPYSLEIEEFQNRRVVLITTWIKA
tara:strand:+ start:10604 stop:11083 length:480 start_codon:yes stop_codon:yes gene_type:complete